MHYYSMPLRLICVIQSQIVRCDLTNSSNSQMVRMVIECVWQELDIVFIIYT